MVETVSNPDMHRVPREKADAFLATVVMHHTLLSIYITRDTTAHLGSGPLCLPVPTTQSLPFVKGYSFLKGFFFKLFIQPENTKSIVQTFFVLSAPGL